MAEDPVNFPVSPTQPIREALAAARTSEELRAIAKRLLAEMEQAAAAGRKCLLCAAPCECVDREQS